MKTILSLIITGLLVVFGHAQTRNVLVGTNNAVVQPTNFWSADASNARIGLGLGTAATSPASSFQPSSSVLTNLSANDGSSLTNVSASNIVGALSIGRGGTGSTNATDARAALGLGTSATNPSSAFQPSSGTLSNLASNNAVNLTNLRATNIVGIIPSSNIPAITLTNISGVLGIVSGGTGATNTSNARINLGATTIGDALFIATNAASARTVIEALATNGNGFGLTNLNASNITGLIPASNISTVNLTNVGGTLAIASGGTGATNAGGARTNLGLGATWLTNNDVTNFRTAVGLGATNNVSFNSVAIGGGDLRLSNDSIFWNDSLRYSPEDQSFEGSIGINNGSIQFLGTNLALNIATTRTNLGLGATWLTNTNVTNFRTAIGLGVSNNVQFAEVIAPAISAGLGTNSYFTANSELIEVTLPIEFAMDSSVGTRTNLGLGASWLTNNNVTNFRTAIGLGPYKSDTYAIITDGDGNDVLTTEDGVILSREIYFVGTNAASNAATTRASLSLGWPALTNSNAGTSLVSVNTNGEVVSPTNFWQAAPIQTVVQNLAPITNSTNAATNARNLYVYSLATNITGVTNTVTLPTNTSTFAGDSATITHQGPTSSVTAVRQAGAGSNLITINRFDESVKFIYENNGWTTYHNISFQEPIYFSGTNASANAAASRTNLGIPSSFGSGDGNSFIGGGLDNSASGISSVVAGGQFNTASGSVSTIIGGSYNLASGSWSTVLGGASNAASQSYTFAAGNHARAINNGAFVWADNQGTNTFSSTNANSFNVRASGGARFVVGSGGISSDGNITINQSTANNGLLFIYRTNNEPFLGLANLIASNNTTVSNETLFRVGVSEATNKAAQFGFRSTNINGDGVAVFSVFGYNALAMIGPSDRSKTNVAIEADIYSISPTNKVMTLVTTNTGATLFHRPIEFNNITNQAVTRTNIGLGGGITTNLDIKLNDNSGMRLYFSNGILTNAITPIP